MKHIVSKLKKVYNQLEKIRNEYYCADHLDGDVSLTYQASSKSWLIHCMEKAKSPDTATRDGLCFWHDHFDPTDWEEEE